MYFNIAGVFEGLSPSHDTFSYLFTFVFIYLRCHLSDQSCSCGGGIWKQGYGLYDYFINCLSRPLTGSILHSLGWLLTPLCLLVMCSCHVPHHILEKYSYYFEVCLVWCSTVLISSLLEWDTEVLNMAELLISEDRVSSISTSGGEYRMASSASHCSLAMHSFIPLSGHTSVCQGHHSTGQCALMNRAW